MKTKAVRLYGANDLRLEEFELPALGEDEILVQIISDSICMSSYKAAMQGKAHKRVPKDVANNPITLEQSKASLPPSLLYSNSGISHIGEFGASEYTIRYEVVLPNYRASHHRLSTLGKFLCLCQSRPALRASTHAGRNALCFGGVVVAAVLWRFT